MRSSIVSGSVALALRMVAARLAATKIGRSTESGKAMMLGAQLETVDALQGRDQLVELAAIAARNV